MVGWPLPTELTSLVFDCLSELDSSSPKNGSSLAASAAVCSQWRPVAERRTFARLRLSKARVKAFDGIVTRARRGFVTEVSVHALEGMKGERADLTAPIEDLLGCIHRWGEDEVNCRGVKLVVEGLNTYDLHQSRRETPGWWQRDLPQSSLPLVPAITSLEIDKLPGYRAWSPAYCSHIVTRLPRLESYTMKKVQGGHQDWKEFTQNLISWPMSIRSIKLAMVNLTTSSDPHSLDVIGLNVHRLSRQLRNLELSACTWTDIFTQSNLDEPQWPLLETFILRYTDVTPAGDSLYTYSDPAANSLRDKTALNDDVLNELYLAAGRAALRMPRLRLMQLGPMGWNSWTHLFVYEVVDRRATAKWNACLHFTPGLEVVALWKTVARNAGATLRVVIACE